MSSVNGTSGLNGHTTYSPENKYKLPSFCIDEARPIKVVIIGAGYSDWKRLTSINVHQYQLTFAENPDWSSFYAPGPEIQAYLESVVEKFHLGPYIKLQHRLTRAQYDEKTGKWHLTIKRATVSKDNSNPQIRQGTAQDEYEDIEVTADVLFTGIGSLSRWQWPEIEGLETFQGKVIHSAQWETGEGDSGAKTKWEDTVKSWGEKKIGVIGVGSSAIQIVPALQPMVKTISNFVRGKTWVSASFVREHLVTLTNGDESVDNYTFTDKDKKKFRDKEYYREFRRGLESDLNVRLHGSLTSSTLNVLQGAHLATLRGNPLQQGAREIFEKIMRQKLSKKPWIAEHCRNGIELNKQFEPHPRTYLGIAVDGFPNWFSALGPNTGVGAGSLLIIIERQVDYAVAATLKLQRERLKSIEVKKEAVDDFDAYLESVFGEKCRSWYKVGKEEGRVVSLWPGRYNAADTERNHFIHRDLGSCLHCIKALEHPRWEDYDYEPLDPDNNRFFWLGNGNTLADKIPGSDREDSLCCFD
ncbi:hypothetical protein HHX47_DHR1000936 [Lentinula edodes]|nr:hypothetical protein HHX47_DHR1000936 [Lentinula edodes]